MFPTGQPSFLGDLAAGSYCFKIPVLSKTQKHMVLVIHAPHGWQQQRDLKILFSLKNLYVMGFLHANKWKLFSDADELDGVSVEEKARWTTRLGFKGSYTVGGLQPDFTTLKLSKAAILGLYRTLLRPGMVSEEELKEAFATLAVITSECTRYPELQRLLLQLIFNDESEVVAMICGIYGECYSVHIRSWDTYCDMAYAGENGFEPMAKRGLHEFKDLMGLLGAVLWQGNQALE